MQVKDSEMETIRDRCNKALQPGTKVLIEDVDSAEGSAASTSAAAASSSTSRASATAAQGEEAAGTSRRIPIEMDSSDDEEEAASCMSAQASASAERFALPVEPDSDTSRDSTPKEATIQQETSPTKQKEFPHPGDPPVTPQQASDDLRQQGNCAFKANRMEEAKTLYSKSIAAYPMGDAAYGNRAMVLLSQKRYSQAVTDCTTVLQLDPPPARKFKALYRRAEARFKMGDIEGSLRDCKVCLHC